MPRMFKYPGALCTIPDAGGRVRRILVVPNTPYRTGGGIKKEEPKIAAIAKKHRIAVLKAPDLVVRGRGILVMPNTAS